MTKDQIVLLSFAVVFAGLFVGALVIFLWGKQEDKGREFQHRERMAAIDKGLDLPILEPRPSTHRTSPLQIGLVLFLGGIGLGVPRSVSGDDWDLAACVAMIGIAMLVHWFVRGKQEWERERHLDEELHRAYIERLRSREN